MSTPAPRPPWRDAGDGESSAAQRQAEADWQQERTARRQAEARIEGLEALLRERDADSP